MKICLAIHSLQAGGMERVMSELANYFSIKKNGEVNIILYGITREVFYPVSEAIQIHKPGFEFKSKIRVWSTLRSLLYLRQTIKKLQPDTILSFGEYWNSFVLIAAFGLKFPVFISDRAQPNKPLHGIAGRLRKILYPRARGMIAQTNTAKKLYCQDKLNDNIQVIGNPIRQIPYSDQTNVENNVLMVGRFINSKNQDVLIKIFSKINNPEWNLVLVGYDHLQQENEHKLKSLAKELGIENRVIFAGKQSNIEDYYQEAKIFAFTSISEGFPNVIGEAMSAGLPVVAFDCVAGPSEMINNGRNGFLIPLFDEELFLDKLNLLIENESMRIKMGKKAREDIQQFSIHTVGDQFYNFITGNTN